ncbi:MAG: hypothetical protein ABSC94_11515 [Polyangiaceae bacterium]|jgi:tetratricopeptide (TPR) repeat protein
MGKKGRHGRSKGVGAGDADPAQLEATPPELQPKGAAAGEAVDETPLAFDSIESRPEALEREESSVPPMGDLDSRFFETAYDPFGPSDADAHAIFDAAASRRAAQFAAAAGRRAHLAKYVRAAVALSMVLCVAAVLKGALVSRGDGDPQAPRAAAAAIRSSLSFESASAPRVMAESPPDLSPIATESAPPESPPASATSMGPSPAALGLEGADLPAAMPAASVVRPEGAGARAETGSTRAAGSGAARVVPRLATATGSNKPGPATHGAQIPLQIPADPELRAEEAKRARESSRAALERGHVGQAVAAGERSVALDATDAEAWLILGASYQEKGDLQNARRCYRTCVQARGESSRSECIRMLR